MAEQQTIRLGDKEYVVVPKDEYLKLRQQAGVPAGSVDAHSYIRASLGGSLRKAREHANLTQAELAARMKVSQPMVSGAESGRVKVSERYVQNVLKACGLPADWSSTKARIRRAAAKSGRSTKKNA